MNDEFFTVSQLNQFIKDVINAGLPQALWVCGEIQGYNRNRDKRHVFFELVEKDSNSKDITARIGLVIFANRKTQIESILKRSENAFSLKDDIEVKFSCKVDFYAPHGAMRLIVESIDPVYTLGKLAQEKQKLIATLKKKGVLDKNKQVELPTVMLNVGLITSDDSAAYNDFISEMQRSGYGFKVYLRNALMQGAKAEKDICKAIDELNQSKNLDVIVITRGGGSIADLSCFDSQMIAEKIAASRLPVFSGIGHEINLTITDMAAHTYAKTPTAIAQFLVEQISAYLSALDENIKVILDLVQQKIECEKKELKQIAFSLQSNTTQFLKRHDQRLIQIEEGLKRQPFVFLKNAEQNIIRLLSILKQRPVSVIQDCQKTLSNDMELLKRATKLFLQNNQQKVKSYQKIIDIAHPKNTMKRGFSITRTKNGKVLKDVSQLKSGDELKTEIVGGVVTSHVKKLKGSS